MSLGPVLPCRFGRYTLVERVGAGGMATVYRALLGGEGGFEKEVAVKVVREEFASDPQFRTLFLDEARLSARLAHANLVQTFDFGQVDGTWFMAMEYVRGRTLANLLRALRTRDLWPGPVRSLHLAAEVAKGLGLAHRLAGPDGKPLGLVHRDVSPQNVLVSTEGEVKLGDFGIAKAALSSHLTAPGKVRGKCAYMAPEQAQGRSVDARADVFALGVVLWECLAGTALFEGGSDAEILLQVLQKDVVPPSRIRADVPLEVDALVLRMLARDPAFRPANGDEAARELAALRHRLARSPADLDLVELERALRSGTAVQHVPERPREVPISVTEEEGQEQTLPVPPPPYSTSTGVSSDPTLPSTAPSGQALLAAPASKTEPAAPRSTTGATTTEEVSASLDVARRWRALGLVLLSAGLGIALGVGALAVVRMVFQPTQPATTEANGIPKTAPTQPRTDAGPEEEAIGISPDGAAEPASPELGDAATPWEPPPIERPWPPRTSPWPTPASTMEASVASAMPPEPLSARPVRPRDVPRGLAPERRSVSTPAPPAQGPSRAPSARSTTETVPAPPTPTAALPPVGDRRANPAEAEPVSPTPTAELVLSSRLAGSDVHVRLEGAAPRQLGWSPIALAVSAGRQRVTFLSESRSCAVTVQAIAGERVTLHQGADGTVRLIDGTQASLLPCE